MTPQGQTGERRGLAELLYGLALALSGVAIGLLTLQIKVAPLHAKVGPTAFPWLVAGGLLLIGLALAVKGWRQRAAGPPLDWPAVLLLAAGLLQQILLLTWAGFVPTAALLFAAVATAFGRRRPLVDLAIGLGLALLAFLVFTRLLGLTLPAGFLAGWL